jgi:hypothetical protein
MSRFGNPNRSLYIATVRAIREMMQAAFMKSQAAVPVRTRALKNSGRLISVPGGAKIVYTKPYAARREYGIEKGRTISVRRHRVGGFRGAMGRRVGGHMRGPYAYQTGGEKGAHFLGNAVQSELGTLQQRVTRHLRNMK